MSKIDNVKRINTDDFPEESREVVDMIAEYYNYFAEQVTEAINGQLNEENFTSELIEIEVTVNESGVPSGDNRFSTTSGMRGSIVVRALNQTNSTTYPNGAPFMTFEEISAGLYQIKHITGLPASNKFKLLIRLIP